MNYPTPSETLQTLPLVEARGVSVRFGRRDVLEAVDLAVHAGEIVTLIGLNGAGKSTLVRVLLGIIRPSRGEVVRAPGLRIGYAPQHVHRDPVLPMTVRRFLTLGAPAAREKLEALLAEVGAGAILDQPLAEISGGELHRVLLARALLREPGCSCSTSRSRESTSPVRASSTGSSRRFGIDTAAGCSWSRTISTWSWPRRTPWCASTGTCAAPAIRG